MSFDEKTTSMSLTELERTIAILLKNEQEDNVKILLARIENQNPELHSEFMEVHGKQQQ